MSWIKHPGRLRVLTFTISDLRVGTGADAGKYAYKFEWGNYNRYVITTGYVGLQLKMDDIILKPVFSSVNGDLYFEGGELHPLQAPG